MSSITKNYIYNVLLQISNIIVPFVTIPYISRILGPEGVGVVAFRQSIVQYFVLAGSLGLVLYGNRSVAAVRDDPVKRSTLFWELLAFKFLTCSIALVTYFSFLLAFQPGHMTVYLVLSLNLAAAGIDISWFFMGLEDFKKTVTRSILMKLLGLVLIFTLVKQPSDVVLYAFVGASTTLLGQAILWGYIPKYVDWQKITLAGVFRHFLGAMKLFVPIAAIHIYVVLDKTMVGMLAGETQVGIYDMSQKLVKMALSIVSALGIVMLPRMSYVISQKDMKNARSYALKAFRFVSYGSCFILFIIAAVAPDFVPLFFGKDFLPAINVIIVLAPIILFIAWSNVLGIQVLVPLGREKHLTVSVMAGAGVNFVLNLFLIPRLGAIGAAIASTVAELCVAVTQLYLLREFLMVTQLLGELWKNLLSGLGVFFGIKMLSLFGQASFPRIFVQCIVAIVLYVLLQAIFRSETNRLMQEKAKNAIMAKIRKRKGYQ